MKFPTAVPLLLLAGAAAFGGEATQQAVSGPEGRRAFDELCAYYKDEKKVPDYPAALKALRSDEAAERRRGAAYLLALLKQAAADEASGRAFPLRPPSEAGRRAGEPAGFQGTLARAVGEEASASEAIDLALWLVEEKRLSECQAAGVKVLCRLHLPRVTEAFTELLARPVTDQETTPALVEEVGRRGLRELAPRILRLCTHYRKKVREAARTVAPRVGIKALPDYKPEEAFTPWLGGQLERIAAMVPAEIPKGARWVHVTYVRGYYGDRPVQGELYGWLLGQTEWGPRVLDWLACEWRAEDFSCYKARSKVQPSTLRAAALALRAARQRYEELKQKKSADEDAHAEASRELEQHRLREMLCGEGWMTTQYGISERLGLSELLVAAWSYVRGDRESAAMVLFPRIDALHDDTSLVEFAADCLGHLAHQGMLGAFVHRDYPEAIRCAKYLSRPFFDGHMYQERARKLAKELPGRLDEWKTFTLPEPDEWQKLRKGMSRRQQIEYLACRLRLLNTPQRGQPGSVDYAAPIDALTGEEALRLHLAGKPIPERTLVNPYVELLQMGLEIAELPLLIPLLADENYIPTYGFWRSFVPARELHRVNWVVARIVNTVAMHDLAKLATYEQLNEAGKKQHIAKILAWCEVNAAKTRVQLALELMERAKTERQFLLPASVAARGKSVEAFPILLRRVAEFPKRRGDVVELCYRIDTPKAVPHARKWLNEKAPAVRFWAALILLRHGDRASLEGLAALRAVLNPPRRPPGVGRTEATGPEEEAPDSDILLRWYSLAVDDLLATRREEAIKLACTVFDKDDTFWFGHVGSPILHRLFLAGRRECLGYLLRKLDSPELRATEQGGGPKRERFDANDAAEMVIGWRTDDFKYDREAPLEERKRKREALKAWLRRAFRTIEAGKQAELMKTEPLPLVHIPFPQWREDAASLRTD